MVVAEEELLPGRCRGAIAYLPRQRKHEGRLVEIALVVCYENHRAASVSSRSALRTSSDTNVRKKGGEEKCNSGRLVKR